MQIEALHKILRYDAETGKLYWRVRPVEFFSNAKHQALRSCASWNTRYANTEAFTAINADGYKCGGVFGRMYLAHRVIWAMVTGAWPVDQIDHINHDKADNKWLNLRDVTPAENNKNMPLQSNNKSGAVGVRWIKRDKIWQAQLRLNGKTISLGAFSSKKEAIAARGRAHIKYDFHPNHGSV